MSHCQQNRSSIQVVSLQDSIQCCDLRRVGQEVKEENDSKMNITISVFLFWEGTGLFCNSCQRVRGHCNFWRVMLGIDMHVLLTHTSSYLSLFSCQAISLLETHNTNAHSCPPNSHPSIPGITSTHLLLNCLEETRTGSCSPKRWNRKLRLEQAAKQL